EVVDATAGGHELIGQIGDQLLAVGVGGHRARDVRVERLRDLPAERPASRESGDAVAHLRRVESVPSRLTIRVNTRRHCPRCYAPRSLPNSAICDFLRILTSLPGSLCGALPCLTTIAARVWEQPRASTPRCGRAARCSASSPGATATSTRPRKCCSRV